MVIFPYSTALQLSRPPLVTYLVVCVCVLVFLMQGRPGVSESLLYYPDSWNPLKMIVSSLAHADWLHLSGNMIFYLAFAPALELLIGSRLKYLWIMLFIALVVGVCDSIASLFASGPVLPTLGFSGVVTGMIGLSAYLMPKARIRVFWWYIFMWKTFFVRAWIVAAIYIGLDIWTLFNADDYGGVNVLAHVSGGVAGYLYGYLWLGERKQEVEEELAHEIKAMRIEQRHGKTRSEAYRYRKNMEAREAEKQSILDEDKFMSQVYQLVSTRRDSEAVLALLERYDLQTDSHELERLFERMQAWGPSRSLLCIGRLIIDRLDREKREGRAIVYIDKCQQISPRFVLGDLSRVLHYARLALDAGRPEVTRRLVADAGKRYGELVNGAQCRHLLEQSSP